LEPVFGIALSGKCGSSSTAPNIYKINKLINQSQRSLFAELKPVQGVLLLIYTGCHNLVQIRCSYETVDGGHLRMHVIGMVCPRRKELLAIEASHSDSAAYQAFLDHADKCI